MGLSGVDKYRITLCILFVTGRVAQWLARWSLTGELPLSTPYA